MSWLKLSDDFPNHPKVLILDDAAFRLHITALCYCARAGTEGFVSAKVVPRLRLDADELVPQLVDVGLWEPCEGGWMIHDYLEYNLSNARVAEIRAVRAEAGRAGYQAGGQLGYPPGKRPARQATQQTTQQTAQQVAEPVQQNSANHSPRTPLPVTQDPSTSPPPPKTGSGKVAVLDGPTWTDVDTRDDCQNFRSSGAYKAWHLRWKFPPSNPQLAILESIAKTYPAPLPGWIKDAPATGGTYAVIEHCRAQARKASAAAESEKIAAATARQNDERAALEAKLALEPPPVKEGWQGAMARLASEGKIAPEPSAT